MNRPFRTISVTLPAVVIAASMTACSRDLPIGPADKSTVVAPQPGFSLQSAVFASATHDDFDNAIDVDVLPFTHTADTREATTAPDDPDCVGNGPTVWYQFTAAADIRIAANTFGSNYDTSLSAYVGTRGSLTQIACNDDAGGSLQSSIAIDVLAGETVFFMVGAFASGPGGDLVFNVDVAPPPLELDLTLDRFGSVKPSTGVATIRGTLTCSRSAQAEIFGILQTTIGRIRVEAFFGEFGTCDGPTPWESMVVAQNALLVGGPVEVSAFAFAFDPVTGDFASAEASATVLLRGQGKNR